MAALVASAALLPRAISRAVAVQTDVGRAGRRRRAGRPTSCAARPACAGTRRRTRWSNPSCSSPSRRPSSGRRTPARRAAVVGGRHVLALADAGRLAPAGGSARPGPDRDQRRPAERAARAGRRRRRPAVARADPARGAGPARPGRSSRRSSGGTPTPTPGCGRSPSEAAQPDGDAKAAAWQAAHGRPHGARGVVGRARRRVLAALAVRRPRTVRRRYAELAARAVPGGHADSR